VPLKQAQVVDAAARRNNDDYRDIESGEVLLIRKIWPIPNEQQIDMPVSALHGVRTLNGNRR
jgi:hypothetical protein